MSTTHIGQPPRVALSSRPVSDELTLVALETALNSAWCFVHITLQDWGLFSRVSEPSVSRWSWLPEL